MDIERLRYKAEQIARNCAALGEEQAIEAIADHLGRFWDARMKAQLLADDRAALSPLVAAALQRLSRSTMCGADGAQGQRLA